METYKNFLDGEWVESSSARTAKNLNPADPSDVIGSVKLSTRDEIRRAVDAAAAAFPKWRAVSAPERGRVLDRARLALARRKEEVAQALTREEGKLLRESLGEVQKSINLLEWMSGEAVRIVGETAPSELPNTFCYTLRQPIGVVAAVTPWNFPVAIPCWKIAPALAAGCTVVFKPATLTPCTAKLVVEIFQEAGLPAGALNLVYAAGQDAGDVLVEHPAVRAISFTGSNDVGMKLYRDGASKGKRVQCEMGGKNAVVVLEDADLDLAADGIAQGAFGSTGQRCTATSRLVVHEAVADRLIELVKQRAVKIEMGPLVDENQLATVTAAVESAKREGARLLLGGARPAGAKGWYFSPTIFDQVSPHGKLAQDEVFGPVLAVVRVSSFDEAVQVANEVRYGLTSSIYSSDPGRILRFVEAVETGITHVNSPTMGGEPHLPFGGMKETGVGSREMGRAAVEFYSEVKTVYWDYTGKKRESNIY